MVFCPKYRRSVLISGVDVRLKELIQQTCEQLNVEIIEMEIMPDHVHLPLGMGSVKSISEQINIKINDT